MIRMLIILALALPLGLAACGKKAPLDPPAAHPKKEKPAQ
jgi:predicted small lipoprotein YifL